MNENMQNMISLSVILALFLSACFIALSLTGHINLALNEASAAVSGQPQSVHSTLQTAHRDAYSSPQAILMTMDHVKKGVRIRVNGLVVDEDDPAKLVSLSIFQVNDVYHAAYIRDIHGNLTEIRFESIGAGNG